MTHFTGALVGSIDVNICSSHAFKTLDFEEALSLVLENTRHMRIRHLINSNILHEIDSVSHQTHLLIDKNETIYVAIGPDINNTKDLKDMQQVVTLVNPILSALLEQKIEFKPYLFEYADFEIL